MGVCKVVKGGIVWFTGVVGGRRVVCGFTKVGFVFDVCWVLTKGLVVVSGRGIYPIRGLYITVETPGGGGLGFWYTYGFKIQFGGGIKGSLG